MLAAKKQLSDFFKKYTVKEDAVPYPLLNEGKLGAHALIVEGGNSAKQNEAIYQCIVHEIYSYAGGEGLLQDALTAGPITIEIVSNPTDVDCRDWAGAGACWDAEIGRIKILLKEDPDTIILSKNLFRFSSEFNKREDFFESVLFELCNAANPFLKYKAERKHPLQFASRNEYAEYVEFLEFKTYQRVTKLQNARFLSQGKWLKIETEYTDAQFNEYLKVADRDHPEFGNLKSHTNVYRLQWDERHKFYKKKFQAEFAELKDKFIKGIEIDLEAWQENLDKIVCLSLQKEWQINILELKKLNLIQEVPSYELYNSQSYLLDKMGIISKARENITNDQKESKGTSVPELAL